jgi:hypothetical protein
MDLEFEPREFLLVSCCGSARQSFIGTPKRMGTPSRVGALELELQRAWHDYVPSSVVSTEGERIPHIESFNSSQSKLFDAGAGRDRCAWACAESARSHSETLRRP